MGKRATFTLIIVVVVIALAGFIIYFNNNRAEIVSGLGDGGDASGTRKTDMVISSTQFKNNADIPSRYTCDALNVSPPIQISEVGAEVKSLALIMDDPDAPSGDWVHWVKFNIPPEKTMIAEGEDNFGISGKGSGEKLVYQGPCPPSGTHRYFFKVYALDTMLTLSEGASKAQLLSAMEGHVIEQAQLVGLYQRSR